ncbi:MAG: methionyl-tRNA formyltransferase, partial [ANME-2 cluster archaeon]|nr:methionyl-tRNA formyltransferase [ANME-2 cluster archaeon]
PKEIFDIPEFRTINIHPSYLPVYRGQHVVNWAIINGENETGVTIHYIDEGIDTGDIIIQKKVPISYEDTAKTLHDKIYSEACELVIDVIHSIASGKQIISKKQDDKKATYFHPRVPEDGRIDWNKSGLEIYNLIRGLAKPWPGAYGYIKGKKIIIWSAIFEVSVSYKNSYGEICDISNSSFTIITNDGKLIVDDYMVLDENENELNFNIEVGDRIE